MAKTSTLLVSLAILLSGCTREVYLQKVPCVEGDCECPYVSKMREDCPQTKMQTKRTQYQLIEPVVVPVAYVPVTYVPVTYVPSCGATNTTTTTTTTTTKSCNTVCHTERVE